ncbi:hypothetical protein Tco_0621525 [Tanacetum coccineum]
MTNGTYTMSDIGCAGLEHHQRALFGYLNCINLCRDSCHELGKRITFYDVASVALILGKSCEVNMARGVGFGLLYPLGYIVGFQRILQLLTRGISPFEDLSDIDRECRYTGLDGLSSSAPEDEVFPAEEQPLPAAASPTAESLGTMTTMWMMRRPPEIDADDEERNEKEEEAQSSATLSHTWEEAPSTSHLLQPYIILSHTSALETPPLLPIPLPTSSPPLLLTFTDSRVDAPEVTLPPQKRLCIALGPRFEVDDEIKRDPERDNGYGITDTWDEMLMGISGSPATNETELGRRVTDLVMTVRHDTNEIYTRLDDA